MADKKEAPPKVVYDSEAHRRFAEFEPHIMGGGRRDAIQSMLPKGATLLPRMGSSYLGGALPEGTSLYGGAGSGGGGAQYHLQQPFMPEMSQDRQQFPQDRRRANFYWRMFHKYDPIFGAAIDMYAEMLASTFDISIPGEDSREIRDTLELMCSQVDLVDRLRYIVKEYLTIGEVFPHKFWSDDDGIWTYIGFHNPDNIDVRYAPIINMDPIISFIPDDSLRMLLSDGTPESMEMRQKLPPEFVAKVLSRQKIRLSNLNCSFIARKLHPYDMRGTSLATRLWRIFMVEDAVYAATIATYRRNAGPLRIAKLGDPTQGWLPSPENESRLLDLLARAESDVSSWLVWNYGINFEAFGSNDRVITIDKQYDVIERIKLVALGLSKGFMSGETSYASTKGGLQVFLRRLLSLRQFIESTWLYPEFFKPVSEMNEWTKPKPAEAAHKYRIKRTAQELRDQKLLIMPELLWHNKLDSKVDSDLLSAYKLVESLGVKMSKSKIMSAVGEDWRDNLEEGYKEFLDEDTIKTKVLGETRAKEYDALNKPKPTGPAGGPGAGAMPPGAAPAKKPMDKAGPGGADKAVPLSEPLEGPGEGAMPMALE